MKSIIKRLVTRLITASAKHSPPVIIHAHYTEDIQEEVRSRSTTWTYLSDCWHAWGATDDGRDWHICLDRDTGKQLPSTSNAMKTRQGD